MVFALIASGNIFAQDDGQELLIGSFHSGFLGANQEIWYWVYAPQAGLITVQTTGNTDTYLEAYDFFGDFIAENDDGPNGYNASLTVFAWSDEFIDFCLTGYDSMTRGQYTISASFTPATELAAGDTYRGNIREGEEHYFYFEASKNGYFIIETSGNTDTALTLFDVLLEELQFNDDGAGYPNDRIIWDVREGRTYIVKVSTLQSGPFGLSVRYR